jgi:hypothetical protein
MPHNHPPSEPSDQFAIDWREYDFFRPTEGLSIHDDSPEYALAYDFELVRTSQPLCARIVACPNGLERATAWAASVPYHSRWFPGLTPGEVPERPELEPRIPTACLLTPWFPAPWLTGSPGARRRVVAALDRAYGAVRPLMLRPYPLSSGDDHLLSLATEDKHCLATMIIIDRAADLERTVKQFRTALLELNLSPRAHELRTRKASAIHALERLCCYRLGTLPAAKRNVLSLTVNHLPNGLSRSRLSRSCRDVLRDFRARHYLLPTT